MDEPHFHARHESFAATTPDGWRGISHGAHHRAPSLLQAETCGTVVVGRHVHSGQEHRPVVVALDPLQNFNFKHAAATFPCVFRAHGGCWARAGICSARRGVLCRRVCRQRATSAVTLAMTGGLKVHRESFPDDAGHVSRQQRNVATLDVTVKQRGGKDICSICSTAVQYE